LLYTLTFCLNSDTFNWFQGGEKGKEREKEGNRKPRINNHIIFDNNRLYTRGGEGKRRGGKGMGRKDADIIFKLTLFAGRKKRGERKKEEKEKEKEG